MQDHIVVGTGGNIVAATSSNIMWPPLQAWPAYKEEPGKMKPFLYAIVKHPTKNEEENGQGSSLLTNGILLAKDEAQARTLAGARIPIENLDTPNLIEVYVRSFQ